MLNWNHLETFVVLSNNLSFSETARLLNTAQPVISRQIKVLEENLGYSLFLRSKKSVALSKEGQELKRKLGPLVDEIKKALVSDQNEASSLLKVEIRMGSMYEAGELLLVPKISRFLEIHPDSVVHLSLMSTDQANELVSKGLLDFAFVYRYGDRKSVKVFPVEQDQPVLIADKKIASKWRKQEVYKFVSYRENDLYLKSFLDRHFNKSERAKVRFMSSVNSHKAIVEFVCRHQGMSVIPRSSAERFVAQGLIEIVDHEKKPQNLSIICHEQILIDKRKKAFLDFLIKEFKAET